MKARRYMERKIILPVCPEDFSFDHEGNIWIVFQEVVITDTGRQVYSDMKDIAVMGLVATGRSLQVIFIRSIM